MQTPVLASPLKSFRLAPSFLYIALCPRASCPAPLHRHPRPADGARPLMHSPSASRRSADTEFAVADDLSLSWQDLTEAGSLKLREVLKYAARGEAVLWRTELDSDAFWKRSGQIIPVLYMEASVSPARVALSQPARVTHLRRFGKQVDARGRVDRLVSYAEGTLQGAGADGGDFEVARLVSYGIFTRPGAPGEKRRVKRLHPSLNLRPVPARVIDIPTVDDLRVPPTGWSPVPMAGRFGLVQDAEPQLWLFSDTDPNRHVHAMSYVARTEDFVLNAIGRREIPINRYYPRRATLLFRRPCQNGEAYFRAGHFYRAPARDAYLFVGAFYPEEPGAGAINRRPAVLVQLEVARRPDRGPTGP